MCSVRQSSSRGLVQSFQCCSSSENLGVDRDFAIIHNYSVQENLEQVDSSRCWAKRVALELGTSAKRTQSAKAARHIGTKVNHKLTLQELLNSPFSDLGISCLVVFGQTVQSAWGLTWPERARQQKAVTRMSESSRKLPLAGVEQGPGRPCFDSDISMPAVLRLVLGAHSISLIISLRIKYWLSRFGTRRSGDSCEFRHQGCGLSETRRGG